MQRNTAPCAGLAAELIAQQDPDAILVQIADYVWNHKGFSDEALSTARYCLIDTLGCGLQALIYTGCTKLMGPVVPGASMSGTKPACPRPKRPRASGR